MEEKSIIELKKVCLEKDKEDEEDNESIFYYDRYSRKIFDVNKEGIRIYNRKAKNFKTNIFINLKDEYLISISVDKELKYLLCLLLVQQKEKDNEIEKHKLVLINSAQNVSCDKIEDDFSYLLGIFFIGKINNLINFDNNNNQNDLYDFCIVHCDRVLFYGIEKKSNAKECIKKLSNISISGTNLIQDFCFDFKHKILCLIKLDLSISFFILSNRKNYKNEIKPKVGYIKTLKERSTLKGMFRRISLEQKKHVKEHFDNLDKYTETQFYLETIYNSLYLICLCYENNKIYFHKLENLNSLDSSISVIIDYPDHGRFSALQVIDNLVIVHNFLTKLITVIDIKSKIHILKKFTVDFPYEKNLHINGEILEERKVFSKKKLININGGTLYNINFNGKIYDEITDSDFKKRNKKEKSLDGEKSDKKEEMNRYDILVNLLHRKGTKDLILNILYRIIINNDERPLYIIKFFKEIISLENETKEKVVGISDKKLSKKELSDSNSPFEVPKPINIILVKKNYIKQIDILINLFDKFNREKEKIKLANIEHENKENKENKENIESENNSIKNNILFDDSLTLRIIFYMEQLYFQIKLQKMELKLCFYSIILKYIKDLKQKEKIIPFFIENGIPPNSSIAEYLLELSMNKNDINSKIYENIGLNILGKLKKYDIIIDYFFKIGEVSKAMNYMNETVSHLTDKQIEKLFKDNKNIIEQNKDLLMNYLK